MANITHDQIFNLMDKKNMTIFQVIDVIIESNGFDPSQITHFRTMVDEYIHNKWKEAHEIL